MYNGIAKSFIDIFENSLHFVWNISVIRPVSSSEYIWCNWLYYFVSRVYTDEWINEWRFSVIDYCIKLNVYIVYPLRMFVAFYTEISKRVYVETRFCDISD